MGKVYDRSERKRDPMSVLPPDELRQLDLPFVPLRPPESHDDCRPLCFADALSRLRREVLTEERTR